LEKEENEEVIGRFMSDDTEFRLVRPPVADRFLTAAGFARTFPQRDGMDGFFIAVFEKI
jgi:16S rRNA C967 or C1407 C5-methylase (RsmB/RsmF family)